MPSVVTTPSTSTEIVLDPAEETTGRVELTLNEGATRIAESGPDWGTAEISAYMAEQARGSSPIDFRIPNRQIAIPLIVNDPDPAFFDLAMRNLQAKVARIQQEGGVIRRGDGKCADLVNASLVSPDRYGPQFGFETDVVLSLEAIPDFYGAEDDRALHTGTDELVFVEDAVGGDYPGRLRLVVNELAGKDQLGLLWGVRCRHYDDADTARLVYPATDLEPLDLATVAGSTVEHTAIGPGWTPILSTNIGGTDFLTHTGSYQIWASVESDDGTEVELRFVWDVGDLVLPVENAAVTVPAANEFYKLNLGGVRLDPGPGAHRWQGQIQARAIGEGRQAKVARLWLQPLDEGAGRLTAAPRLLQGVAPYLARDDFVGAVGALDARTAPLGGVWDTSGATGDFTHDVDAGDESMARTSVSDSGDGRVAILGTAVYTDVHAKMATKFSAAGNGMGFSLIARYVNATNYAVASFYSQWLSIVTVVAGTPATISGAYFSTPPVGNYYLFQFLVTATGQAVAELASDTGQVLIRASGTSTALATGGALEDGTVGFLDINSVATANTRRYKAFSVVEPNPLDAVLYANQSAQLGHDGMFREDSTGTAFGSVSSVVGDLARVPPSGPEGRPVEFFLLASNGDFGALPDTGDSEISAQAHVRESFLFPT